MTYTEGWIRDKHCHIQLGHIDDLSRTRNKQVLGTDKSLFDKDRINSISRIQRLSISGIICEWSVDFYSRIFKILIEIYLFQIVLRIQNNSPVYNPFISRAIPSVRTLKFPERAELIPIRPTHLCSKLLNQNPYRRKISC